jgi:SAM-dependent methyltransferase
LEINLSNTTHEAANPSYWQSRWREGRTAWDQGGVHPLFNDLMREAQSAGLKSESRVIEPGCGRAHTGAALAKMKYQVTSFDVSKEAVEAAKLLYAKESNLNLIVADLFSLPVSWSNSFDAIYDRAVLCALPPPSRPAYVATCLRILKSGGLFLSIPFTKLHKSEQSGPPFAIDEGGIEAHFGKDFVKVVHRDMPLAEPDAKIASEMIIVWRKK